MERIIIRRRDCIGTDTKFVCTLQKEFMGVKRMRLSGFACSNLFSNFSDQYDDFSFYTANGKTSISMKYYNLNMDQFFTRINNAQSECIFSIQTDYYGIISIRGSVQWSPLGNGWNYYFGYQTLYPNRLLSTTQLANSYYDLSQSKYVYILLNPSGNSFKWGIPNFTFSVGLAGKSNFQDQILYEPYQQEISNEVYLGGYDIQKQIEIQLLDDEGSLLHTTNGDQSDLQIIITLDLYYE